MYMEPKVKQTYLAIEESKRDLDRLQVALADARLSIEDSVKLLSTPEETRLAERVKNPIVRRLLLEAAENQDRMAEGQAPGSKGTG